MLTADHAKAADILMGTIPLMELEDGSLCRLAAAEALKTPEN